MRPGHPDFAPRPAGGYVALGRGPSRAEATVPEGAAWVPGVEVPLRSRFPRSIRVVPQPAFPLILDRTPPVAARSPSAPPLLTRLRGPSITSIDPGVSGGPRRNGGAREHGGAARARDAAAGGRLLATPGAGSERPRATAAPLPPPTPRRGAVLAPSRRTS